MIYFIYNAFRITELSTKSKKRPVIEEEIMASKGQKFKKYDIKLRLKIVDEKLKKGKSYYYLAEKYGISGKTIETWVRIFKRDGGLDVKKRGRPLENEDKSYKERYEILKKYQDFLEEVEREKK